MESPRLWSRAAGFFYLITIVAGVFAELFVRGKVIVPDNAGVTTANILAHESLYRAGLCADLVMLAAYVAVTVLLYLLFKPVSRSISLAAACFSLVGIAVLAVNSLNHIAPLILLGQTHPVALVAEERQGLIQFFLRLHGRGYNISSVFFGSYCLMIGCLAFRSRFLPRFVGVLMCVGGAAYLLMSFLVLLAPAAATRLPDMTVLGGIAELVFAIWLLVPGVNVAKWGLREQE